MRKMFLLAWIVLLTPVVGIAGIIDPCGAPVFYNGAVPECYFACPQGDTESFMTSGFWFRFKILDLLGQPIAGIPGTDFWMIDCDPQRNLSLCAGSASSNADSSTNAYGVTTMSLTTMAVGGCSNGLSPVVQGYVLENPFLLCSAYCFDIRVRSCDRNGDLLMDIVDVSILASDYPPNAYDACSDFDCNGVVNLVDLVRFAEHYGPPGHRCF